MSPPQQASWPATNRRTAFGGADKNLPLAAAAAAAASVGDGALNALQAQAVGGFWTLEQQVQQRIQQQQQQQQQLLLLCQQSAFDSSVSSQTGPLAASVDRVGSNVVGPPASCAQPEQQQQQQRQLAAVVERFRVFEQQLQGLRAAVASGTGAASAAADAAVSLAGQPPPAAAAAPASPEGTTSPATQLLPQDTGDCHEDAVAAAPAKEQPGVLALPQPPPPPQQQKLPGISTARTPATAEVLPSVEQLACLLRVLVKSAKQPLPPTAAVQQPAGTATAAATAAVAALKHAAEAATMDQQQQSSS
jgi:hypothetical protein